MKFSRSKDEGLKRELERGNFKEEKSNMAQSIDSFTFKKA